jgi:hypothetical protein
MQHKFIWQHDKNLYTKLLGTYLNAPQWIIRFVKFTGTQQEKTEEYFAFINNNINNNISNNIDKNIDKNIGISRIYHKIPEDKPGENLTEKQARVIAHTHLTQALKLDPKNLKEITAKSEKLKDRLNWKFVFLDLRVLSIDKTEARIVIHIGGDSITDAYRYIKVPEQWLRSESNKQNTLSIIETILLLFFTSLVMLIVIIVGMHATKFSKKYAIFGLVTYFATNLLINFNLISNLMATFDPIKPFYSQLLQAISSIFLMSLIISAFFGLAFGLIIKLKNYTILDNNKNILKLPDNIILILLSISTGLIILGVHAFISYFKPSIEPIWPDYNNLAGYWPIINIIIRNTVQYLKFTGFFIIFTMALNYIYKNFKINPKHKYILISLLFILTSFAITECNMDYLPFWAIKSLVLALTGLITYIFFVRLDLQTIPFIVATIVISGIFKQIIFAPYPNIFIDSVISILIIIFLADFISKKLGE